MASKLAVYDTGYDDDRFEHVVSRSFHCIICTNVIKDPVMCRHNEHLFCRACINEHLKNSQTCPSCMDSLTVDTLSQAPRGIKNLLNELKIKCEFFDRGCGKFMELGNLESHVRDCGFAPAVCSNEGCELEMNKRDLLHHETVVCEQRRVKCHSCNDIEVNLVGMSEKLDRNEKMLENVTAVVENVVSELELIKEGFNKHEENNRRRDEEMKTKLSKISTQLERMTQEMSRKVQTEQEATKKVISEVHEIDREPKVVIAGGMTINRPYLTNLNSVEMFSLSNGTWTPLQPMTRHISEASSFVYNNQFIVIGGDREAMQKLVLHANQADKFIKFRAQLPGKLYGHCTVVHNGRLIVIGGYDEDKKAYSNDISVISLVPPHTCKQLATMEKSKNHHGAVLFRDVIVIVGGREGFARASRTVVMYDITRNEFKELAPLPYPVHEMAIVKWGDDNMIIMGGADTNGKPLNTVLIYNINTQESFMLPGMKHKRKRCVAAVVRDTVIVMGGLDETDHSLKSVEGFRFDRYTWEELPEMHEERCWATAAVC